MCQSECSNIYVDLRNEFLMPNLYINLACLSVCLFVCLYPINVKTAEPIRPKFCVGPLWSQGRFINDQNFKNLCLKVFYFENAQKILWNPQTFFVFDLYCTKRRCSEIKPQLKVEIEDGRSLVTYKSTYNM